jgi:hypothetical protein
MNSSENPAGIGPAERRVSPHTPGPWVTGNTDPLLFGAKRGNGAEPLGFVYGPSFPERSEVGRRALANARLAAAAPELLECLRALEVLFAPNCKDSTQADWLDKAQRLLQRLGAG